MAGVEDITARKIINHISGRLRDIESWHEDEIHQWIRLRVAQDQKRIWENQINERLRSLERWRRREYELQALLHEVQSHKHQQERDGARLAIFLVVVLVVLSLTTGVVYSLKLDKPERVLFDFASYVFPALAAVVAGLTTYLKNREIRWFWLSVVLVFAGLAAFLKNNGINATLLWNWIIAYGAAAMLFAFAYLLSECRRRSVKAVVSVPLGMATVVLFGLAIWAFWVSHGSPNEKFSNWATQKLNMLQGSDDIEHMSCTEVLSRAADSTVLMRCRKE